MVTTTHSDNVFRGLSATTSHLMSLLQDVGTLEIATQRAEADVLEEVVRRVQPLIKYLDKKIEINASWSNHYAVNDYKADYLHDRAISLVGKRTEERASADADADTIYAGTELVLTRFGKFFELVYKGSCSQYQGYGGGWKATFRHIVPEMAIYVYGLDEVLSGLQRVLREALEKLEERKQNLQKRLEFLNAISLPN